jgi:putative peptide zinc metalloprotease protein
MGVLAAPANGPAASPVWERVAGLRPRLRGHARIQPHRYRGQTWYVLHDGASGRSFRFGPDVHRVLALMDGRRTVQAIWEEARERTGEGAPGQDQVIQLLAMLNAADLMLADVSPDLRELLARRRGDERGRALRRLVSPLSQRFTLVDPEPFLRRAAPLVSPLFSWTGLVLWTLTVGAAVVLGLTHWPEIRAHWALHALEPENLLLLALAYVPVKALHELGHAFAVKAGGGEVHELGVMLLVLMPLPYVDASAAAQFPDKRRRMAVGAAGILTELLLAALATFVWVSAEPGVVRDLALNVMVIGSVSTLLFNGNPLLRYDGYYVLADAVEIPNLGPRSTRYLGYLVQRYLFGLPGARSPVSAPGERGWFLLYGPLSAVYRVWILVQIILFVAGEYLAVGVVLAVWATLGLLVYPSVRYLGFVLSSPTIRPRRAQAVTSLVGLAVLLALALLVPVPSRTGAEGVVWAPERSQVRAGADGFVARLLASDGDRVRAGDPLAVLEDPSLAANVLILERELQALATRHASALTKDRLEADALLGKMEVTRADLARAREREGRLVVASPVDGTLVIARPADLPGRYVRKGDLVAYVVEAGKVYARVVVAQAEVERVRHQTRAVQAKLAGDLAPTLDARVEGEVPSASNRLPSRALGTGGGGRLALDPRDAEALTAQEPMFQFDVALPAVASAPRLGTRVYVRFDHGREPLGSQWYRELRTLFLRRFDV